jgi:hypothetical protein
MRQLGEYGTLLAVSSALVICQRGAAIEGELLLKANGAFLVVDESVRLMWIADVCTGTMAWYEEDKLGKRHYDS